MDDTDLPPEVIEENGHCWERTNVETKSYQWVRPMDDGEYSWDSDEVSLTGTDVPIRLVSLQYLNGEWFVEGSETAGPDYHRPGFTELIGAEYSYSTTNLEEAVDTVYNLIKRLS